MRHYDTQVCWNNIPASSIGCFGMCSLTTVFALMLFAKMFLQILMVTKKETKGWNSNGNNTHAKGWQVGVRDDAGVEGDILEGEEEEGTRHFSTCVKRILRPMMKRPM